jgi:hypothetical protein
MSWIRALILIALSAGLVAAQRQVRKTEGTPLQPGTPIERSIAPGMIHHFSVTADENNLVQINVEQRGIDVVITIYAPSGKKISEHDSPTGTDGPENVSFVVVEKGPYRVAVSPLNPPSEEVREGRYEIKIIEVRQATEQEIKGANNQENLKNQALALLAEIEGVIPELRVPQTRIRTQLRAAQMLWDADEKRALKYMTDAITGVKELRANADPDTREYIKTYHAIASLRYEIIQALIQRQPEMALTFLRSVPPLDDPYTHNMRMQQGSHEASLEAQIANQIASKDPKRALEIARESLKSRYSSSLISTVQNLRRQHPEMAAELASDIATKLLSEKNKSSSEIAGLLINLLQTAGSPGQHQSAGTNGAPLRTPLISEQQYRDLIQKAVNEVIAFKPPATNVYSPERDYAWGLLSGLQSMKADVESVMNGGAALIEKKANDLLAGQNPHLLDLNKYQTAINDPNASVDDTMESLTSAPKELQNQLYMQLAGRVAMNGDIARAKQIIKDHISNAYERQQALANVEQQGMYRAMSKGKTEEAIRSVANIQSVQERASMLSQIAGQIGPGLKRAAALNLLEQARALLPPSIQAQDQVQMNALCEIARAFSRYDSKRAFEILDPLVDQFNEISAAARVLEGFGAEYYVQDELDLQNGNAVGSFAVQMTTTIAMLGLNNFDRAKLTSDRIRLPEVRLRAYLDLAQLALQPPR